MGSLRHAVLFKSPGDWNSGFKFTISCKTRQVHSHIQLWGAGFMNDVLCCVELPSLRICWFWFPCHSVRCSWSPGKWPLRPSSIPETAVTQRLAPGVSLLKTKKKKEGGVDTAWLLQTDSTTMTCVCAAASHFCPFTKPSGKRQVGSRNKCTERQRNTPAEACPSTITVYFITGPAPREFILWV